MYICILVILVLYVYVCFVCNAESGRGPGAEEQSPDHKAYDCILRANML